MARAAPAATTWAVALLLGLPSSPIAQEACEFVRPPMGWNSYDSTPGAGTYGIDEATALSAARFVASHLKEAGYEYIVLDAGWWGTINGSEMALDDHGRLIPSPSLHPSSAGGVGFRYLADEIHKMGLKFGFWIMGGIPRQAAQRMLPILDSGFTCEEAADLTDKRVCSWQPDFVYGSRLNDDGSLHPAAVAYYNSLAQLYTAWGADFIKMDCVFGGDFGRGEADIRQFSASMDASGASFVLSLSPGSSADMASVGRALAASIRPQKLTMARMTTDFWDSWKSLYDHFAVAAQAVDFEDSGFIPDLDMLPLGWVAPQDAPERYSRFNLQEARSLITLMVMARAPLIWGGAATEDKANATTLQLLSNADVLHVSRNSCGNRQVRRNNDVVIWAAAGRNSLEKYIAFMNVGEVEVESTLSLADEGIPGRPLPEMEHAYVMTDLWDGVTDLVRGHTVSAHLMPHESRLLRVSPPAGLMKRLEAFGIVT